MVTVYLFLPFPCVRLHVYAVCKVWVRRFSTEKRDESWALRMVEVRQHINGIPTGKVKSKRAHHVTTALIATAAV